MYQLAKHHQAHVRLLYHQNQGCQYFFLFIYLFILRERESTSEGGEKRGEDKIPSRLCTASTEPNAWLKITSHEIMT